MPEIITRRTVLVVGSQAVLAAAAFGARPDPPEQAQGNARMSNGYERPPIDPSMKPKKGPALVPNPNLDPANQENKQGIPPIVNEIPGPVPPNPQAATATDEEGKVVIPTGSFAKHFIDPDGDCKLVDANEKEGSLKLWVPATSHDLSPTTLNGPRVLLEADGDFVVEVRVCGTITAEPGLEYPGRGLSFRSGTLLIWHDAANFMRFDRAGLTQ